MNRQNFIYGHISVGNIRRIINNNCFINAKKSKIELLILDFLLTLIYINYTFFYVILVLFHHQDIHQMSYSDR